MRRQMAQIPTFLAPSNSRCPRRPTTNIQASKCSRRRESEVGRKSEGLEARCRSKRKFARANSPKLPTQRRSCHRELLSSIAFQVAFRDNKNSCVPLVEDKAVAPTERLHDAPIAVEICALTNTRGGGASYSGLKFPPFVVSLVFSLCAPTHRLGRLTRIS